MSKHRSHPEVTPFQALRDDPRAYNWYLGTPRQLIEAGVVGAWTLKKQFRPSGQLRTYDEFGDGLVVEKRAKGRLRVKKLLCVARVSDQKLEATTRKAVDTILRRMRRPRGRP